MYRLAIVGSRGFTDRDRFYREMQSYVNTHGKPGLVVSGGARGVDTMGEQWAVARQIPVKIFQPDWQAHGRRAGILRNTDIINSCDRLIAFHQNGSRGTSDSINKAKAKLGEAKVTVIAL